MHILVLLPAPVDGEVAAVAEVDGGDHVGAVEDVVLVLEDIGHGVELLLFEELVPGLLLLGAERGHLEDGVERARRGVSFTVDAVPLQSQV